MSAIFVLQNCEILHSVRGLYDKNSASCYCFTSDVMDKKYKRMLYTSQTCWQDFVKYVNLSNAKFGLICFSEICFPGLIYCDQEPLSLLNVIKDDCYFLERGACVTISQEAWFGLCVQKFPSSQ